MEGLTYPLTRKPFSRAVLATGSSLSRLSATVQFVLALENASVAAANREISVVVGVFVADPVVSAGTPVASMILIRFSRPLTLGTR